MQFGINFFSSVRQEQKSAAQYFDEALRLCTLADEWGYSHVRTVEHYFRPYGGMTPNPIVFLSAAAARTKRIRLVTGAVIPIFNHPIKLAGELAMLDAISGGRLTVGLCPGVLARGVRGVRAKHGREPRALRGWSGSCSASLD